MSLPCEVEDATICDSILPVSSTAQAKNAWPADSAQAGTTKVWTHDSAAEAPLKENIDPVTDLVQPVGQRLPPGRESGLFAFADHEAIKERVRQANLKPHKYEVSDHYHTDGFFQAVARHHLFENFTLGVIVVNAIWIWIDTDYNKSDGILSAKTIFVFADIMFFLYFVMELFVRFMAFKRKYRCLKDPWFVFDSLLVGFYFFDPFILGIISAVSGGGGIGLKTSILRLFRLARLSRLIRILRSLPELMIMIKGMLSAAASVGYTLILLMIITYVFAIAMTQLSDGSDFREEYFSSVPLSMYSLIIYGTFLDDLASFANAIRDESTPCLMLATLFVALASLTVMNMLIGVLCEVISAVALEEKETMMIERINDKFENIVNDLDANKSGTISWEEFQEILSMPEALRALQSVNVDPVGMVDMAEDFFMDDKGEPIQLTFEQFMEMILDSRGGQPATLKDVMSLRSRFNKKFLDLKDHVCSIDDKLDQLLKIHQRPPCP